mmetsp:Transcript_151864/g.485368  ORF Transcript_151864/g.485368 Transcript_151864/m.485368 type:complete len:266 (-) Transcript_151864:46-843(-)
MLLVRLGFGREVGHRVPLRLELGDGSYQLWDGGRDVRELDDVRGGVPSELPEGIQVVVDALRHIQGIREVGEDAPRDGDVRLQDLDVAIAAEGTEHRQQGVRREHGRLVRVGVDDLHVGDGEKHIVTTRAHLVHDLQLCALGQLVQPLRELNASILVNVELREEPVNVDLAGGQVQVLKCELELFVVQGTATIAVVPLEGLRQDDELLLGGRRSCLDGILRCAGRCKETGSAQPLCKRRGSRGGARHRGTEKPGKRPGRPAEHRH